MEVKRTAKFACRMCGRKLRVSDSQSDIHFDKAHKPHCHDCYYIQYPNGPAPLSYFVSQDKKTIGREVRFTKGKSKYWTDITAEVAKACGIKPRRKKKPQKKQRAFVPLARRTKHKRIR
jgi:sulfatase maturation enzyme AslB (radical SAM superfamily)